MGENPQDQTYVLDMSNLTSSGTWVKGPTLHEARFGHSCGAIDLAEKQFVVVAGGARGLLNLYINEPLDSVEMLEVGDWDNSWIQTRKLPRKVQFPSALLEIQSNPVVSLMVHRQSIFFLHCLTYDPKDCWWREAPKVWKTPKVWANVYINF